MCKTSMDCKYRRTEATQLQLESGRAAPLEALKQLEGSGSSVQTRPEDADPVCLHQHLRLQNRLCKSCLLVHPLDIIPQLPAEPELPKMSGWLILAEGDDFTVPRSPSAPL